MTDETPNIYAFNLEDAGWIVYKQPEYSNWNLYLTDSFSLRPLKGKEPNWFHRKMQTLLLGWQWKKSA